MHEKRDLKGLTPAKLPKAIIIFARIQHKIAFYSLLTLNFALHNDSYARNHCNFNGTIAWGRRLEHMQAKTNLSIFGFIK